MISLVYITEGQSELCVDLSPCEDIQVLSNPYYLHGVKRVIEYIQGQLVCNFYELTCKNVCFAVLRDGCWSKLQELYINDSQDTSLITLHEHFALGKVCSTPLDETSDQLLW